MEYSKDHGKNKSGVAIEIGRLSKKKHLIATKENLLPWITGIKTWPF
jgi:hypothetical protein